MGRSSQVQLDDFMTLAKEKLTQNTKLLIGPGVYCKWSILVFIINNYISNKYWNKNKYNNRIDVNIEHKYKYTYGDGTLNLQFQSSTLGSAYDYNTLSLSAKNNNI